jgi:methionyl-tRNA formyltransferase
MRIAAICNTESLAFPTLHFLNEHGFLSDVFVLEKYASTLLSQIKRLGVDPQKITLLTKKNWESVLTERLSANTTDMVWVFGFPWKIPSTILDIPAKGFFNFHFGLLPKYKGADPIFWQIRNGEEKGGLVIHKMTPAVDEGPIVHTEEVQMIPGETYGLYCQRMGNTTVQLIGKFIDDCTAGTLTETAQQHIEAPQYWHKPDAKQLSIDWQNHTAREIEQLVNASNPRYGGASVIIRNLEVRILEVAPADVTDITEQPEPGLIVYADTVYGLIVACRDKQFLRINILHSADGYLSGSKLFNLGIKAGDLFTSLPHHQKATLN